MRSPSRLSRGVVACSLLACGVFASGPASATNLTILHTFTSGATDGHSPTGLLLDNGVLYGTTRRGGLPDAGTVYKLNADGTGFGLLHSFTGGTFTDGQNPRGNVIVDNQTLYGTTGSFGGSVYKINTDGTGFAQLHQFNYPGTQTDPQTPVVGVTQIGNTLYGTTADGGANAGSVIIPNQAGGGGTVFRLGTDGTGFTELHGFNPTTADGHTPRTALTTDGSTLYGMTQGGNPISPNAGTVFKINADGTGFNTLFEFDNTSSIRPDGAIPAENQLVLVNNRLYGTTQTGGFISGVAANRGVLFAIDTDGSNFDVLHTFGAGQDGISPMGALALDGNTLYGVTLGGGDHSQGTIYQIDLDGTGYQKIHDFAGGANDGARPFHAGLIYDSGTLYGTTTSGGQFDIGVVYTLKIPEPAGGTVLLGMAGLCVSRVRRRR